MSELKPCPFCGTQLDPQENQAVWDSEQFYEHPKVEDCHLSGLMFPEKFWNTRPIEDKLQAELARRDEIITRLKEDGERLWNIADTYSLGGGCMGCKLEGIPSPENVWGHTPDCPITLHRALMKEQE